MTVLFRLIRRVCDLNSGISRSVSKRGPGRNSFHTAVITLMSKADAGSVYDIGFIIYIYMVHIVSMPHPS